MLSGDAALQVARIQTDSRRIRPGDLFVAVSGATIDGHGFIGQAVSSGASAVVVERAEAAPTEVATILVPDGRRAAGLMAHRLLGDPTEHLTVCGITGTNGKTTSTYLLRSILQAAGRKVGLIGTIAYEIGNQVMPAPNTTPGAVELAELFQQMVQQGCDAAVMEVSSHALDQGRTAGVRFRSAAFTNLTAEHLDYHHDMDGYRTAKGLLFSSLEADATAVLNADDAASQSYASATRARVLWFSLLGEAEVCATRLKADIKGTKFTLHLGDEAYDVALPLIGRHNVYNAMTAAGIARGLAIPAETIVRGLQALRAVPGRLEPVDAGQPFGVLVDYAHTDDALENCLSAARPLTRGRLIVVFGCGGDRDRSKRPRMAAVAERLADVVIITSDNPRTEKPATIAEEILAGLKDRQAVTVELDRAAAIAHAIAIAGAGDTVVIAGKGHEDYQIVGSTRRHFDDREAALEALASRGYSAASSDAEAP